jgi:hypothetical protein
VDHKAVDVVLATELERGLEDILARGGCVFPICSDSKLPLPLPGQKIGKPGKGGYKLATNDPRVIWHYFRGDPLPDDMPNGALKLLTVWRRTEQPNAAVALDMSDMLVLDADDLGELAGFQAQHGMLPATYCVRSPREGGGLHYYFKASSDVLYRRTIEGFPHLDIKRHGYVLIAGSVKRNDVKEVIGRYFVVDSSPIADLPDWLLALVKKPPVVVAATNRVMPDGEWGVSLDEWAIQRGKNYLAKMPPAVSGHGGHNATFAAACVLVRGFALSEEDAYDILVSDFNPRCEPPWAEWELRHKIRSAMDCATTPLGYLLDAKESERPDGYEKEKAPAAALERFDVKPLWE